MEQSIESVIRTAGQVVTFSYWVKASKPIDINLYIYQYFGSGGGSVGVNVINTKVIDASTTWQRMTRTFTVPSISGKNLGSGGNDKLQVYIQFPMSNTYTVDVANVQLEIGPAATEFEQRSFGEELALCQRYYEKSFNYVTAPTNGSSVSAFSHFAGLVTGISTNTVGIGGH